MIYIIYQFSINSDLTPTNRINSFYNILKKNNFQVKLISSIAYDKLAINKLPGDEQWVTSPNDSNITEITKINNYFQRKALIFATNNTSRWFFRIINLIYYVINGRDVFTLHKELNTYFSTCIISQDDIFFCSGTPSSVQLTVYELAKKHSAKLFLDYRDPWTYDYKISHTGFIQKMRFFLERKKENKALYYATAVTTVKESLKRLFPQFVADKVKVIENGCNLNEDDFYNVKDQYQKFKIVYLGNLYSSQFKDQTFFKCLAKFIEVNNIKKNDLEVSFYSGGKTHALTKVISQYFLKDYINLYEWLDIKECIRVASDATAFLHLKYAGVSQIITSKQADYLALQKPILLPSTDNGDIAESIISNKAGYVCKTDAECLDALNELWGKFIREKPIKLDRDIEFLHHISRAYQAQKLVDIMNQIQE